MNHEWWKKPLRVIQTNLQVLDTPKMEPEKIAAEMEDLGANVLVVNVGGIYAWYPTEVPFHTVNPCLPESFDLLQELIVSCHRRNIRLVARYDFSKASDSVYQRKPQWFSRNPDGTPQVIGAMRPGQWDLLYSTCINSGYRNGEVAEKVLRESLSRYEIDGVFFNAPHPTDCHCSRCKEKYRSLYGEELPDLQRNWRKEWKSRCLYDNITRLRQAVQETRSDVPVILYYSIASDNLFDRLASCDMICAEPQDVLSLGWKEIPQSFKPALCIRLGRSEPVTPRPFGIIHSCPGMDWRHTGLPSAEYLYWMSQVPANGGQIWHSITGFPDTISDKRILENVRTMNRQIMKVEKDMEGARSRAAVALLWDMDGGDMAKAFGGRLDAPANSWAEAMLDSQIPFDVLLPEQICQGRLKDYQVLVAPSDLREGELLKAVQEFVHQGGCAVVEASGEPDKKVTEWLGIRQGVQQSEPLNACYLRMEPGNDLPMEQLTHTPLLPLRGRVLYAEAMENTKVLGTLVPPFAPMEAVGAPPERASIPCSQTDLPMLLRRREGAGSIVSFLFPMAAMIGELKLNEHTLLVSGVLRQALGNRLDVRMTPIRGIQLMEYEKPGCRLIHLVNGIGQRPLSQNIPCSVTLEIDWADEKPLPQIRSLLGKAPQVCRKNGKLEITPSPILTWEVICLDMKEDLQ